MNYLESGSYLHGSNVDKDILTLVTLVIYLFLMVRVGPD